MELCAEYVSPDQRRSFVAGPHGTTDGVTTGPSAYVLNAGQVDRDRPVEARSVAGKVTYLGQLRNQLTGLQDDINEYLTLRMEAAKSKKLKTADEQRIEKEINTLLDGGDDEE